jgi:hypothetical protein
MALQKQEEYWEPLLLNHLMKAKHTNCCLFKRSPVFPVNKETCLWSTPYESFSSFHILHSCTDVKDIGHIVNFVFTGSFLHLLVAGLCAVAQQQSQWQLSLAEVEEHKFGISKVKYRVFTLRPLFLEERHASNHLRQTYLKHFICHKPRPNTEQQGVEWVSLTLTVFQRISNAQVAAQHMFGACAAVILGSKAKDVFAGPSNFQKQFLQFL